MGMCARKGGDGSCVFVFFSQKINYQEMDSNSLRKGVVFETRDKKAQRLNNVLGEWLW